MLALFALVSFTTISSKKNATVLTGKYGTCGCDENGESSQKIELIINQDFTFHYFDNSNSAKKIDLNGNWTFVNNAIVLKNYKSDFSICDKWRVDKNGKCLESRSGLAFTRLCHIDSCK